MKMVNYRHVLGCTNLSNQEKHLEYNRLPKVITIKQKSAKNCLIFRVWWHLPSVLTHTQNLCSAFNPSKCTHTAVSSELTHQPEQWAVICSSAWRKRALYIHFPTYYSCLYWDSNPWPSRSFSIWFSSFHTFFLWFRHHKLVEQRPSVVH